jgi:hypothetical protein
MSTTHIQCGVCSCMPMNVKAQFAELLSTKVSSTGAGQPYWAESAKQLGLVNTEEGIFFIRDLPPGVRIMSDAELQRPKPALVAKKMQGQVAPPARA